MPVGTLGTILRFLFGGTTSVCTCNIGFLLGFGLDLSFISVALRGFSEDDSTTCNDVVYVIVHNERNLVVEQANADECHCDIIFIASLNDVVVSNRTTCLCDVFYTTLVRTLDIVAEWEESVTTQ